MAGHSRRGRDNAISGTSVRQPIARLASICHHHPMTTLTRWILAAAALVLIVAGGAALYASTGTRGTAPVVTKTHGCGNYGHQVEKAGVWGPCLDQSPSPAP